MIQIRGMSPATAYRATAAGLRKAELPCRIFLCVADHFEPDWGSPPLWEQQERVERWVREYPQRFGDFTDSRGRPPQHSFFYPGEVYQAEQVAALADLVDGGWGDVEVHLHHDDDNADRLRHWLTDYTSMLFERHGLLRTDDTGMIRYGFIHGNWALDNSHPDDCWCGVDDELTVLNETGCYADFTMPSAPHPTQTSAINRIYYAQGKPGHTKNHDDGIDAAVGQAPPTDGLLMVQGPLVLHWHRRGLRFRPRLENGDLAANQPPSVARLQRWVQAGVSVKQRTDWIFIKLHTHGAKPANCPVVLGEPMQQFHSELSHWCDRTGSDFYYVTAWEMAQLVHQAEAGVTRPDFEAIGSGRRYNSPRDLLESPQRGDRKSAQGVALGCDR